MADIIKEILKKLPEEKISMTQFEGANIVLYTKDEDYFNNSSNDIKKVVNEFKKRISYKTESTMHIYKQQICAFF